MFNKSTDYGSDVMVAQFVFLFIVHAIFQETSTEMDIKPFSVITVENSNFPWPVLLLTIETASKCSQICSETTHLWLVPLKF